MPSWLDALKIGGKLQFPLTPDKGSGAMAYLTRKSEDKFEAQLTYGAMFIPFCGARDAEVSGRLADAFRRDKGVGVKSLRCDGHGEEGSCWLHGEGWCFSTRAAVEGERAA
jgi:protein-L-isoaspartate(D-aspartate) O-methyltransferase